MAEVTEAQAPIATVTTDPQALSVLQRSLAALTPNIVVPDVTLSGSAHYIAGSDDETGTAVLKATALGDSRLDLTLPSGMITEIDNLSATSPAGAWFADDRTLHKVALHNLLAKPLGSPRIPVLQISATIGGLAPNSSVPFPLQSARPSNTALPHLLTVPSIKVDLVQQTSKF